MQSTGKRQRSVSIILQKCPQVDGQRSEVESKAVVQAQARGRSVTQSGSRRRRRAVLLTVHGGGGQRCKESSGGRHRGRIRRRPQANARSAVGRRRKAADKAAGGVDKGRRRRQAVDRAVVGVGEGIVVKGTVARSVATK